MESSSIGRGLHFVGGALGLAGVVFVGIRLHEYAGEIDFARFDVLSWGAIGLLALIYSAANVLLARAWWYQLAFSRVRVNWPWALNVYGRSQLAKYVPGNIFHLAGRQALGMAAGLPARPLAQSAAWELCSIAVAGACFGILALPLIWPSLTWLATVLLFVVFLAALHVMTSRLLDRGVATALLLQAAFLAVSGLVFMGTLALVTHYEQLLLFAPAICGAYVVAWLAGLVTPGAPAGVGVREIVLLVLLQDQVGFEVLLLSVVLGRFVTVLGDLIFFASCSLSLRR